MNLYKNTFSINNFQKAVINSIFFHVELCVVFSWKLNSLLLCRSFWNCNYMGFHIFPIEDTG